MKILITSLNYDNYNTLSAITWEHNKVLYAERHGYSHFRQTEDKMLKNGLVLGFEKIYYIWKLLETNEYDYIWFVGCDTLIMNFNKRVEDVIAFADKNESFIVATDCNGINMDSFIVKNTDDGKRLLKECYDSHERLNSVWCYEQQWFWDNKDAYKDVIKIVPQKTFNSYYSKILYPNQSHFDTLGTSSDFSRGDFLLHFAGIQLEKRIKLTKHFSQQIIH